MSQESSVIQGLWVGDRLSTLERLSIQSYLSNDHQYHLYTYGNVDNVPAGTTIMDGSEILPASAIFRYRDSPSFAGFSNYFRHKLLLMKGGWWSDLDVVCCRYFDFEHPYVFACEELPDGTESTANCVMKVPRQSPVMQYAWDVCRAKDPQTIEWGETGPRLMHQAVNRFSLHSFVTKPATFCPVSFFKWAQLISPSTEVFGRAEVYAVHLWNEVWRRVGADKDLRYSPTAPFEQLKTRYCL